MRFAVSIGLTLFVVLVGAGCAGMRPRPPVIDAELPAAFPHHTADQIGHHIVLTSDTLQAFRAKASLAVSSPERSGRFSADIRNRRSDSLYMTISPGLGIEAARVLVTPDSIFLYNRIENELTYGALAEAGDLLGLPLSPDDIFRNLLGIVAPEPDVVWQVEADDAYYYLHDPSGTRRYMVDPSIWRVVQYEERTSSGELVESRTFSDFDLFDGIYLPRRVVLRRPLEASTASIYYRSLNLNPSSLSFAMRVSGSAERRRVTEQP